MLWNCSEEKKIKLWWNEKLGICLWYSNHSHVNDKMAEEPHAGDKSPRTALCLCILY